MYSWIASWFTDSQEDTDRVEFIMQEEPGQKDEWIWIETLQEESSDGYIYIQSVKTESETKKQQKQRRKRSFPPDIHERARKRARFCRSRRGLEFNEFTASPFTDSALTFHELPLRMHPYAKPYLARVNSPRRILDVSAPPASTANTGTVARWNSSPTAVDAGMVARWTCPTDYHYRVQSPSVATLAAMAHQYLVQLLPKYGERAMTSELLTSDFYRIGQRGIDEAISGLTLLGDQSPVAIEDDLASSSSPILDYFLGYRKQPLSICWREQTNCPKIDPVKKRYRLPIWMKRIKPNCVEYEDDCPPQWLRRIQLDELIDEPRTSDESPVHSVPSWMRRMNVIGDSSSIDSDSFHYVPHWLKRIELSDSNDGGHDSLHQMPSWLAQLDVVDAPVSRHQRRLNHIPPWVSDLDVHAIGYDTVFPRRISHSCDSFIRGSPWDYAEDVEHDESSLALSSCTDLVLYGERQLVPYGCRDIVPYNYFQEVNRQQPYPPSPSLSDYCSSLIDVAWVVATCTMYALTESSSRRSSLCSSHSSLSHVKATTMEMKLRPKHTLNKVEKSIQRSKVRHNRKFANKPKSLQRANIVRRATGKNPKRSRVYSAQKFSGRNGVRAC